MADFIASRKTAQDFNNGVKYINQDIANNIQGDSVSAETVNNLIESALYTQAVAESAKALAPLVGMHYIQYPNEPTPAEIWGGTTWEIDTTLQGRTLIGSGGSYSLGATGGSNTHNHNMDNAYAELYCANKNIYATFKSTGVYQTNNIMGGLDSKTTDTVGHSSGLGLGGKTSDVSNMPPYIVVNYWKRTA